ncbi:TniQ family protein [Chryseobacterium gambrini]|uniref:TniQ family protein n=1 Tax=Chryseobacterium gambrini TaxID=373672 RepID=A0ABM8K8S7_9FLAO|nr:TniQ family protein [Chryseobacterium gambrini]
MVYIPSLNKTIIPICLKPNHDELFSSWLFRLSNEYNLKPYTFLQNYIGFTDFKSLRRDLDLSGNSFLIDFFTSHTPLRRNKIKKMFLSDYSGKLFTETSKKYSTYSNILPLGLSNRENKKQYGLQYCPNCLKENGYYKKNWRLITSLVCLKCYCYLKDRCENCGNPINFFKIFTSKNTSEIDYTHIDICFDCKKKLFQNYQFKRATEEHISYQRYINGTIKNGYNNTCNYSFFYIKPLLYFSGLLKSSRKSNKFREYILDIHRFILNTNESSIEFWSIEERLEILPLVNNFLRSDIQNKHLRFYKLSKGYVDSEKILPYWIYKKFLF